MVHHLVRNQDLPLIRFLEVSLLGLESKLEASRCFSLLLYHPESRFLLGKYMPLLWLRVCNEKQKQGMW